MLRLYFIRHAESEANELGLLAGRKDYALSAKGREDARTIAEGFVARLKTEGLTVKPIDRLISSPLARAQETARPFSLLLGIPIETDPALIEQDMGIFAGSSYSEAEADPRYELDKARRWDWVSHGGESYRAIADRLRPFFARIDELPERSRVLVVTHAVTLRLICGLLNDSLPSYRTSLARNGEILSVDYAGMGRFSAIESLSFPAGEARRE